MVLGSLCNPPEDGGARHCRATAYNDGVLIVGPKRDHCIKIDGVHILSASFGRKNSCRSARSQQGCLKRKAYPVVAKRCNASLSYVLCTMRRQGEVGNVSSGLCWGSLAGAALRGDWPMFGQKDLLVSLTCDGQLRGQDVLLIDDG